MKDVFMMSAVLGFRQGLLSPIRQKQDIFQWPVFTTQDDIPTLQALAIAKTGGVAVLGDPEQVLTIAEEFANGGIAILKDAVLGQPGVPLDNLIKFLICEKTPEEAMA
jgi:hypothetical protein